MVKEGKADVNKYPITEIKDWYDTPDTITTTPVTIEKKPVRKKVEKERPIYKREPNPKYWDNGGNGLNEVYDNDRGWEPHYVENIVGYETYNDYETVYEDIRKGGERLVIKNNKGAMPVFRKLVNLGYKPETPENAQAFVYMAEKLKPIIEREKIVAEANAKYEAEQKRRDSEIEKIGDCPLGQKLLVSALIKAGVMRDGSQAASLPEILANDTQRQEFTRLQKEGIMSEKFEILKPYEFINSKFFTSTDMYKIPFMSGIRNIPAVKKFSDEAQKQHDALLKAQKEKEDAERRKEEAKRREEEVKWREEADSFFKKK